MKNLFLTITILISTSSCTKKPEIGSCFVGKDVVLAYDYSNMWKVEGHPTWDSVKLHKMYRLYSSSYMTLSKSELKEKYVQVECQTKEDMILLD